MGRHCIGKHLALLLRAVRIGEDGDWPFAHLLECILLALQTARLLSEGTTSRKVVRLATDKHVHTLPPGHVHACIHAQCPSARDSEMR